MIDTIQLDQDTPTDELMTVLERTLSLLILRVGTGTTIATLFGTAVLMVIDDVEPHDG